jgi:hypothetical protein
MNADDRGSKVFNQKGHEGHKGLCFSWPSLSLTLARNFENCAHLGAYALKA